MDKRRTWCIAAFFLVVLLLTAVTASAQSFVAPPESLPGGAPRPRRNRDQQKPRRIDLTTTGLLMEGDYTQYKKAPTLG